MLKIRLQRIGRKHDPHFRIVAIDSRRGPKAGKYKELLGSYNAKAGEVKLKADRIKYWLSVGAQVSGTVWNFLVDQKIVDGKKRNVLPKKTVIAKEVDETVKEETKDATPVVEDSKEESKEEVKETEEAKEVEEVKEIKEEVEEVKEVEEVEEVKEVAVEADDLTKIEGIGPVIAKTLAENGITTFTALADAKDEDTQEMIKDVKGNHQAGTWNEQAALARDGKWDELKTLQDALDGGIEK